VFVMLVCACCGRARAGKGEESRVCCEGVPFVFCLLDFQCSLIIVSLENRKNFL